MKSLKLLQKEFELLAEENGLGIFYTEESHNLSSLIYSSFADEDLDGSNETPVAPDYAAGIAPAYFNWRKISIYGGSNEIQRNIIAKAVLGL